MKTLTNVGNSKAVIIPKHMIEKYHLDTFRIEEREEGLMILSGEIKSSLDQKLESARKSKSEIYTRMEQQSNDPETQRFYEESSLPEIIDDL